MWFFSYLSQAALVEDFRALRKQLEAQGLFRTSPLFFIFYLGHILLLEALALALLWTFGNGWIVTVLISIILATSQVRWRWKCSIVFTLVC